MVFSSTLFLFAFLPVTLAGYFVLGERLRNYWLLLVSLVFFGWSQPNYLWIIILNILINYTGAMLIDRFPKFRKTFLTVSVALNLAILFYFKYFDFAIDSVNKLFNRDFALRNIILPIGISFFTFQGMSYVVDVYRKDVAVQKNIFKVGLYIVLFPQLIAGPIVRYKDIAAEVDQRRVSAEDFACGGERFIVGLGKKAVIANTMAVTADAVWANGAGRSTMAVAWVGSIAYMLQIYFDFSGYSDMAIGLGRMFGFHFLENFNLPYVSRSITEFWRRWHISLSSWFRDYVYIPLGGNRRGNVYLHLWTVFLLTGIWHGASWHFLAWGVWHGFFIFAERLLNRRRSRDDVPDPSKWKILLSKIYTLLIVNLGWVLFRATNTGDAVKYVCTMFGIIVPEHPGFTVFWYLDRWTIMIMILGIIFASSIPLRIAGIVRGRLSENAVTAIKYVLLILLFFLSALRIVSGTYNPFIYFQF